MQEVYQEDAYELNRIKGRLFFLFPLFSLSIGLSLLLCSISCTLPISRRLSALPNFLCGNPVFCHLFIPIEALCHLALGCLNHFA